MAQRKRVASELVDFIKGKKLDLVDEQKYSAIVSEIARTGELNSKHERILFEIASRLTKEAAEKKNAPTPKEK